MSRELGKLVSVLCDTNLLHMMLSCYVQCVCVVAGYGTFLTPEQPLGLVPVDYSTSYCTDIRLYQKSMRRFNVC